MIKKWCSLLPCERINLPSPKLFWVNSQKIKTSLPSPKYPIEGLFLEVFLAAISRRVRSDLRSLPVRMRNVMRGPPFLLQNIERKRKYFKYH